MDEGQVLEGYQRAALLRQAHHLSAVATVGKQGPTEPVLKHVDEELDHHELIKVRFADFKEDRREIARSLAAASDAFLVAVIGHVAILYRQARDPAHRQVRFPVRS